MPKLSILLATLVALTALAGCDQPGEPLPTPVPRTPVRRSPRAITPANAKQVKALQCVQAGNARQLAFSPDGKLLAVTSGLGLALYDAQSLAQLRLMYVPDGDGDLGLFMFCVAFSPDGSLLASGSLDGYVRLWRVSDGALLPTHSRHSDRVIAVAFSADGQTLASASYDSTVRVWRVADGTLLRTIEGFEPKRLNPEAGHCLSRVAFSADGAVFAWACDKAIGLGRTEDGARLRTLRMPEAVQALAFSPDGTLLAAGTERRFRIWRLEEEQSTVVLEQRLGTTGGMAISPDGQILARGSDLWSVAENRHLSNPPGGKRRKGAGAVGFSPDGALLVTGSEDGIHCFWGVQP